MAITVMLHNADIRDLFVSVSDLNQSGSPTVLSNLRLNQGQTGSVGLLEDGDGNGNMTWIAQQASDASTTAQRTVSVTNASTVDVTTQFDVNELFVGNNAHAHGRCFIEVTRLRIEARRGARVGRYQQSERHRMSTPRRMLEVPVTPISSKTTIRRHSINGSSTGRACIESNAVVAIARQFGRAI